MVILEDVVCGDVNAYGYCIILRGVSIIYSPLIDINGSANDCNLP